MQARPCADVDVQDPTGQLPLHRCRMDDLGTSDPRGLAICKYCDEVHEKSRDRDGSFIMIPERGLDVAATLCLAGGYSTSHGVILPTLHAQQQPSLSSISGIACAACCEWPLT